MPNLLRTFIAVPLPQEARTIIQEIQTDLQKCNCDISWVKPENIHLTLKFLGDTASENIEAIKLIIKDCVRKTKPFDYTINELGAFPSLNKINVLWLGIDKNKDKFRAIVEMLEENLCRIGFPKENRSFSAHITLGRIRSNKNIHILKESLNKYKTPLNIPGNFSNITLFKSTLTPTGPIYEVLDAVKFI